MSERFLTTGERVEAAAARLKRAAIQYAKAPNAPAHELCSAANEYAFAMWLSAAARAKSTSLGPVLTFGRSRNKRVGEAPTEHLIWARDYLAKQVKLPALNRNQREADETLLKGIRFELDQRGEESPQ